MMQIWFLFKYLIQMVPAMLKAYPALSTFGVLAQAPCSSLLMYAFTSTVASTILSMMVSLYTTYMAKQRAG